MSQMSNAPVRQSHHILIIDDSARLRYALADLIVSACLATGKSYRVFHGDKDGRFVQSNESLNPSLLSAPIQSQVAESNRLDEFAVYTAPSPKQALFVINSPLFTKLTIICDVMMPSDTEVGIVGMLEVLARRNLPVNLVFASSDAQNRVIISKLVDTGKAYFVVKAGGVWEQLSQALVNHTGGFQYKYITPADYAGLQGELSYATRSNSQMAFGHDQTNPPRPVAAAPAPPPTANNRPTRPAAPPPQTRSATPPPPAPRPKSGFNPFASLLRLFRGR